MQPHVSVVIPTRNRPLLVGRAVQSALTQTFKDIEVIVVIDGLDEVSSIELAQINDPRLRVIELPNSRGGSGARNAGVIEAKAEWIAFLDDDDEWLPQKLEMQLEADNISHYAFPIITSRLIARTPNGDYVWPRRLPLPTEPISTYCLARNSLFRGETFIQTSTLLTKRELLLKHPFRTELKKHQDLDWILRICTIEKVEVKFVDKPLAIWNIDEERQTITDSNDWLYSLTWIREYRQQITPKVYASFILTRVSVEAAQQRDSKAFIFLLKEAMQFGKPQIIDFLIYLAMWLIPRKTRRRFRDFIKLKLNLFTQPISNI